MAKRKRVSKNRSDADDELPPVPETPQKLSENILRMSILPFDVLRPEDKEMMLTVACGVYMELNPPSEKSEPPDMADLDHILAYVRSACVMELACREGLAKLIGHWDWKKLRNTQYEIPDGIQLANYIINLMNSQVEVAENIRTDFRREAMYELLTEMKHKAISESAPLKPFERGG